jgi:hypothetical protein
MKQKELEDLIVGYGDLLWEAGNENAGAGDFPTPIGEKVDHADNILRDILLEIKKIFLDKRCDAL